MREKSQVSNFERNSDFEETLEFGGNRKDLSSISKQTVKNEGMIDNRPVSNFALLSDSGMKQSASFVDVRAQAKMEVGASLSLKI